VRNKYELAENKVIMANLEKKKTNLES